MHRRLIRGAHRQSRKKALARAAAAGLIRLATTLAAAVVSPPLQPSGAGVAHAADAWPRADLEHADAVVLYETPRATDEVRRARFYLLLGHGAPAYENPAHRRLVAIAIRHVALR